MMATARNKAAKFMSDYFDYLDEDRTGFIEDAITLMLKEQDRDTRHACAEAVIWGVRGDNISVDKAHSIVMNTKAV